MTPWKKYNSRFFGYKSGEMKTILFMLVSFTATTATITGLAMMGAPNGAIIHLSLAILEGTPFHDFTIPGIMITAVGLVNLVAVVTNMWRKPNRYNWALAGGIMITGWILAQIILMPFSWLQLLYLGVGVLSILIAYQLKGKWAV